MQLKDSSIEEYGGGDGHVVRVLRPSCCSKAGRAANDCSMPAGHALMRTMPGWGTTRCMPVQQEGLPVRRQVLVSAVARGQRTRVWSGPGAGPIPFLAPFLGSLWDHFGIYEPTVSTLHRSLQVFGS